MLAHAVRLDVSPTAATDAASWGCCYVCGWNPGRIHRPCSKQSGAPVGGVDPNLLSSGDNFDRELHFLQLSHRHPLLFASWWWQFLVVVGVSKRRRTQQEGQASVHWRTFEKNWCKDVDHFVPCDVGRDCVRTCKHIWLNFLSSFLSFLLIFFYLFLLFFSSFIFFSYYYSYFESIHNRHRTHISKGIHAPKCSAWL